MTQLAILSNLDYNRLSFGNLVLMGKVILAKNKILSKNENLAKNENLSENEKNCRNHNINYKLYKQHFSTNFH